MGYALVEMTVIREPTSDETTFGSLYLNGVWHCWTLEDAVRDQKIYGRTAIPGGRYDVAMTYSRRFNRRLPELLNVPDFTGVRIHAGNSIADTEGCILVGQQRGEHTILRSMSALEILCNRLAAASKITLEVRHL